MSAGANLYFRYWGKARTDQESSDINYHLLPYHSLDVAAVASAWWDSSRSLRHHFSSARGSLSEPQLKAWILFFISLHDYGKLDIRFQCKVPGVWKRLQVGLTEGVEIPSVHQCKQYDHGLSGLFWFDQDNRDSVAREADGWSMLEALAAGDESGGLSPHWLAWMRSVAGHHGFVHPGIPDKPDLDFPSTLPRTLADNDKTARLQWVHDAAGLFLEPVGLTLDDTPPNPSNLLAGFCSVSDWMGSRSDESLFKYEPRADLDLSEYFESRRMEDAEQVLELAGLRARRKPFGGVQRLLPAEYQPRQLQTLVDELPAQPGVTVVEAPTGSGKTEMALAYAWRLLDANLADSIIFAMPTQATANAMLKRVEQLAKVLFEDNPNLVLAHGNARFNEDFSRLKTTGSTCQGEEAWAQCNAWLAESRKRIFLGQIGICTIDQVLISVLPVKHRFVRGFGVGRSVLIVDEVHAYDAYMYGLLNAVLDAQREAGGSALLLSATLNQALRDDLLASGESTLGSSPDRPAPYPLVSWSGERGHVQAYTLPQEQLPEQRTVQTECLYSNDLLPDSALCQRIIEAAENGAKVAVICNLVDVAQSLYQHFSQATTTVETDIFHARFCLHDRLAKENSVLSHYGVDRKDHGGRILIATQVIEQSLDIDLDWLITQLCPVDLLFQRMGRLHRHAWRERPRGFEEPVCTVLMPSSTNYGLHGLIYANTRVLWRTVARLKGSSQITFPEAYRDWIETIYQLAAWGSEPAEVEVGFEKFGQDQEATKMLAAKMLRDAQSMSFRDIDENIRAVTRDGEFSATVIPFLQTTQGRILIDGTAYEKLSDSKEPEAVAMNAVAVPNSWRGALPEQDDQGRVWLEMQCKDGFWLAQMKGKKYHYSPELGLERTL